MNLQGFFLNIPVPLPGVTHIEAESRSCVVSSMSLFLLPADENCSCAVLCKSLFLLPAPGRAGRQPYKWATS